MTAITVEVSVTREQILEALLARLTAPTPIITTPMPRIGEIWPGAGGVFAGTMRGENGAPDWHLIVPTHPDAYIKSIAWGGCGVEEAGSTHERDGLANTLALSASDADHPAAEWAAGLTIDGCSDFYLPARRELRMAWINVPELFADGWYWSSTQSSPGYAWLQDFGDGLQTASSKGLTGRARAFRRLLVI